MFRRRRIFAHIRNEGFTYDEIAAEEGVSGLRESGSCHRAAAAAGGLQRVEHANLQWTVLLPRVQDAT